METVAEETMAVEAVRARHLQRVALVVAAMATRMMAAMVRPTEVVMARPTVVAKVEATVEERAAMLVVAGVFEAHQQVLWVDVRVWVKVATRAKQTAEAMARQRAAAMARRTVVAMAT